MKCNDYFYSDMFLDVLSGFMVIILYVKKKKNYSLYIYGICNFKMLSMQWRIKLTSKYQIELISATVMHRMECKMLYIELHELLCRLY